MPKLFPSEGQSKNVPVGRGPNNAILKWIKGKVTIEVAGGAWERGLQFFESKKGGQTIFEVAIKSNSISDLFFKKYSVSYDLLKAVFENQNRDTNAAITLSFYQKKKITN